jgi:aminomethyltransferase
MNRTGANVLKTTPLHPYHIEHAKLTEFAGYEMPLWYSTTTAEHLAVRNASGIFDVSHMGRFEVSGSSATGFLEGLVPTQVQQQPAGKAFYTLLLNDRGGIIDDLIITRLAEDRYVMVVNAANAETDMRHIRAHAPSGLALRDFTESSAMIAVQGPSAQRSLQPLTPLDLAQLKRFRCAETTILGNKGTISRTGYTGEDGFEVILTGLDPGTYSKALSVWKRLLDTSAPCGLGARDSLRLEAGYPLHGSDIDQDTDPFQAELSWVISAGKGGYVGSDAIRELAAKPPAVTRRGLVLDQGIPRHGFPVFEESEPAGTVTSGTFSPVLRKGIALGKVKSTVGAESSITVQVRGSREPARMVRPPFYDERIYGWKRASKGN